MNLCKEGCANCKLPFTVPQVTFTVLSLPGSVKTAWHESQETAAMIYRFRGIQLGARSAAVLTVAALLCAKGQARTEEGPLRIVAFGDSTTATREGIKAVYAQRLAELLPKRGLRAQVINAGVGGNTTTDAIARFDKDVLARKPDLVIMQFGLNDAAVDVWKDPNDTTPRVALAAYRDNLRKMIGELKQKRIRVILMTPNPMCWTAKMRELYGRSPYDPADPQGFDVLVKGYASAAREIAKEQAVTLVDVHADYQRHFHDPQRSVAALVPDGVHPNDQGHAIVAELLIPAILKEIRAPN